jgi:hypothetical protein
MTSDEAATLIDAIAESLERNPDQFHLSVTVVGTSAAASGPGSIGINATAVGGGAGSKTTGLYSGASSGDIQIARGKAGAVAASEERGYLDSSRTGCRHATRRPMRHDSDYSIACGA